MLPTSNGKPKEEFSVDRTSMERGGAMVSLFLGRGRSPLQYVTFATPLLLLPGSVVQNQFTHSLTHSLTHPCYCGYVALRSFRVFSYYSTTYTCCLLLWSFFKSSGRYGSDGSGNTVDNTITTRPSSFCNSMVRTFSPNRTLCIITRWKKKKKKRNTPCPTTRRLRARLRRLRFPWLDCGKPSFPKPRQKQQPPTCTNRVV